MLRFHGHGFYALADVFGSLQGGFDVFASLFEILRASGVETNFDPNKNIQALGDHLTPLRKLLEEYDLQLSLDSFDRLQKLCGTEKPAIADVTNNVIELQGRIRDELSHIELWLITEEEGRFLKTDPFGPDIPNKFASARDDIEEAGKCLAYGRGTACVFHLMRVMEIGLRALGKSLNDPTLDPKTNPSWEKILGRGDKELAKHLKDRTVEWRADEEFFSTAQANLRAVKDAWRNPTMHVERKYNPEEAEEVWNAARAFMPHLSRKLSA